MPFVDPSGVHPAFDRLDHRPWPLPPGPWVWRQSWRDLLFAHWPIPVEVAQGYLPPALTAQAFAGTSWVGLVPFRMAGVGRRPFPDLRGFSAFPELNVRLYVEHQGKPGVWFLSLDASNRLAVWAARRFFHLPYFKAQIHVEASGDGFRYTARRSGGAPTLDVTYTPVSPPAESAPGTLEHFLTERYCLYAQAPDGSLWRDEIHHQPWPLQKAEATIVDNSYLAAHRLALGGPPAHLAFARRLDVVLWPPVKVAG